MMGPRGPRSLTVLAAVLSSSDGELSDSFPCFADRDELKEAVDAYIAEDCAGDSACAVGRAYGWPMNAWCVSNVTDMSELFLGAEGFDGDVSSWDVSKVTDTSGMFRDARVFNGDVSAWDVSKVTDMSGMFWDAREFDGDVSAWDVSRVVDMSNLFKRTPFNGDLSAWDVSRVTNMDSVFQRAEFFNGDLSAWDVSKVTDMSKMFQRAWAFNGDVSAWDVSRVADMGGIFYEATAFQGDVSSWNVTNTGEPCSRCDFAADCFDEACEFRDSETGEWSEHTAHCNFGAAFCEFCFTDSSCYGFGSDNVVDGGEESAATLSTEQPAVTEEDQYINDQSTEAKASLDLQVPTELENDGSADEIVGSDGEETIDDNDGVVDNAQSSKEGFDSSKGSVLVATSGLVLALLGMI